MKSLISGMLLLCGLVALATAQTNKFVGITEVAAAGSINANQYKNSFLGLTVDAPNATLSLNPTVAATAQRARLLQVLSKQPEWEETYTLAVLADLLAVNPLTKSPADYVRTLRQKLNQEGSPTVREEFSISIAGMNFTGAVLQQQVPNGRKYYRGIYTTFSRGYIVSLDVEAPSQERLNELVTKLIKFEN
jgi:hypothetical protein